MSGSGGGGGGGGPVSPSRPDCSTLVFRTPLASPKPKVIAKLKKGDQLELIAQTAAGPAIVQTPQGEEAGSITSRLADLLRCLDEGYKYVAIVMSITGGNVEVEIRPRSK
jgi:hypothetical protein